MVHQWTGKEVKAFRLHLGMNQVAFCALIGAGSIKTLSRWENAENNPSNSYCRVLDMIAKEKGYEGLAHGSD